MLYKITKGDFSSILAEGKYCKIYTPKTMVTAIPNTLGLMLFDKKINAINFISMLTSDYPKFKYPIRLLEVRGLGQQTVPKQVCRFISEKSIYSFYHPDEESNFSIYNQSRTFHLTLTPIVNPIIGTVCYKRIIVDREITQ